MVTLLLCTHETKNCFIVGRYVVDLIRAGDSSERCYEDPVHTIWDAYGIPDQHNILRFEHVKGETHQLLVFMQQNGAEDYRLRRGAPLE